MRAGWFCFLCSCFLPVYVLATAWIIVRKPSLGDTTALGLAKAELVIGCLVVTGMQIFSYFCLCHYPFEPRMWLANMCYAGAAFVVHGLVVALCVAGVLLRYRTRLVVSALDVLGMASALLSVTLNMLIGGVLHG